MKTRRKQTALRVKLKPCQAQSDTVVRCRHRSQTACFSHAVARSIAKTQKKGNPVARYDVQNKRAYLEYPDGKKVYVE